MEQRRDKLTALYIDAVLNGMPGFEPSRCLEALLDVGISRITAERLVAQEKVRRRPQAESVPPTDNEPEDARKYALLRWNKSV
jgi:hypothetical protein